MREESFPVGSGRLGAMVRGGRPGGRIALNEDTFWSGPGERELPKGSGRAARSGKSPDRRGSADGAGGGAGADAEAFQPVGDLEIEHPGPVDGDAGGYRRTLDAALTAAGRTPTAEDRAVIEDVRALPLAAEAAAWANIRVIITGGLVRAHSLEAVGPLSEGAFNSFTVATAVLGADGLSAEYGVTTHDQTEARVNRTMVAHANRVIVVADGTKTGRATRASLTSVAKVHDLVTDDNADPAQRERIRDAGVHVHIA